MNALIKKVKRWAADKNLLRRNNANSQMLKVMEEIGETAGALASNNIDDVKDEIGDSFVTLIILSYQLGLEPKECLEAAWDEIKNRTGKTENGVFIKSEDNA